MTPDFRLMADDADVSAAIKKHFMRLTLTDRAGMEADELTLSIADPEGKIALPRRGVKLVLALGWKGQALTEKGSFVVDEVSEDGPPDVITITARAADFRASLKAQREASYHNTTLGTVLRTIAGRHSLTPAVSSDLAAKVIAHIDQTGESDANFITRLGKDYGAIATIKNENLLFLLKGTGLAASGKLLSTVTLKRSDGDRHSYRATDRDGTTTGVMARWHNHKSGKTNYALAGEDSVTKTLKRFYPSEAEARAAADAEWRKISRTAHTFNVSLAVGRPDILSGAPVRLEGWRSDITSRTWVAGNVTHVLDADSGLTTEVEAEEKV